MHTQTHKLYSPEEVEELRERAKNGDREAKELLSHLVDLRIPPTQQQLSRGKIGRNDPCPCGSGKKFKKCCLGNPCRLLNRTQEPGNG